ncbi:hypothetical protein GCM10011506_00160 [Marivirga lumbricoides]|uniref:Deacylase n=1 Tax=Marivirga lumbricoides TaxID=1046115 RepID=A0ABQ1L9Q3_9BACT|nr:hypothetical protein GCM10011506_00160 [Marivirga lumbricoides]
MSDAKAQEKDSTIDARFIIPELFIGRIVPNHLNYPPAYPRIGAGITYYKQSNSNTSVNRYFRNPMMGVHASFHYLGNANVFGNEISVLPVIGFPMNKGMFQFGLGFSYFTKMYKDNKLNEAVGSHFTWAFHSFYYRHFLLSSGKTLRMGFGFVHGSNGHTQLPNFGINSAVISIGIYNKPAILRGIKDTTDTRNLRRISISTNTGWGFHEFGGTSGPVGGGKKAVYSSSLTAGIVFKNQFRWSAGFGIRHYEHFADSIASNPELQALNISPNNYYFIMGAEFLIHHVGLSFEGGINLYKPFYEHFAARYESKNSIKYHLRGIFQTRLGIRLYLLNTSKQPRHNLYLAPYLNANLSKADFSELSVGYVYNFRK